MEGYPNGKDLGLMLFGCNKSLRLTWNGNDPGMVHRLFGRNLSLYVCVPMLEMMRSQGTWCAPGKFSYVGRMKVFYAWVVLYELYVCFVLFCAGQRDDLYMMR